MGQQQTLEDRTAEILEAVAQSAKSRFIRHLGLMAARTESPIEELFLGGLIHCSKSLSFNHTKIIYGELNTSGLKDGIHIFIQAVVGPYRADFFACAVEEEAIVLRVIAECDGHDFHERTKEQATRDKKRDRYFAKNNIRVLRYTGSEVWRDPIDCAYEFLGVLENALGGRPWDAEDFDG